MMAMSDPAGTIRRRARGAAVREENPFVAIPQCIGSVEETLAILRASREDWLRPQAMRAAVPDR
jgi:hypothetical protein